MSDDTRVLLYSLKHGGYCVSFSRSRAFNASLKGAEQFEPKIAAMFIQNRPSLRLVIADLDGWITHDGGDCPVDDTALVDVRWPGGEISTRTIAGEWYWPDDEDGTQITAWRPAQEERDGQRTTSVEAASALGLDAGDVPAVAVGAQPPVAGPVTPDAAGVGGVREAMELLQAWPCVQQCDDGVIPVQVGPDEWAPQQCQFCDERKRVLAILAALPEGELIDAGEYPAHMHYGSPAVAFPVIPTPTVGTYRVFLQRKEVG